MQVSNCFSKCQNLKVAKPFNKQRKTRDSLSSPKSLSPTKTNQPQPKPTKSTKTETNQLKPKGTNPKRTNQNGPRHCLGGDVHLLPLLHRWLLGGGRHAAAGTPTRLGRFWEPGWVQKRVVYNRWVFFGGILKIGEISVCFFWLYVVFFSVSCLQCSTCFEDDVVLCVLSRKRALEEQSWSSCLQR